MLITAALLFGLSSQVTAYTGATVHTFVPDAEPVVATIVVDVDRIVAIGPDVEIPADARRVDLSGFHVVPGLIDGFVNHDPDHDRLYVSAGVTCVRDTGNERTRIF